MTAGWALVAMAVTSSAARAAGADCIAPEERQRLEQVHERYASKYELKKLAQQLVELNTATIELEDQLTECRRSGTSATAGCAALARAVEAKKAQRQRAADGLSMGMKLQSYLATLEMRLERPTCH